MSSSLNNSLPKVAIIGRPNVGKSTLYNILTDSRKAVVKDQPGVTRDILVDTIDVWGKPFEIIDTGGITEATDTFSQLIREQVKEFLSEVDLLILVMDGRAGLVPEDRDVIKIAKSIGKEMVIVVNKIDKAHEEELLKAEFYEFGTDLLACSFEQRRGIGDLLEWLHKRLPENTSEVFEGASIAIVGKPNVGKSSLINALLGDNRMLVSDIAGTTVDSVDTPFVYEDRKYLLVDTAGLRRSARREEDVEIISAFKAQESIRRAQIVLLVVDCTLGPTDQDAKILSAIVEHHKGVILVANKADLGKAEIENYRKWFQEKVANELHFFTDIPVVFTSAKTGMGLRDLLNKIQSVSEKLSYKITTKELNDFFFQTIRMAPAPVWGTTNVKFYYLTQTHQKPPSFIAFANHPDGVTPSYRRFLAKHIKEKWHLEGIPIRIFVMKSGKKAGEEHA
jgi:GTP-binding protein